MNLAVSTWNYLCAHAHNAKLEEAIREIREDKFGIELWLGWIADPTAFDETRWARLRAMLEGTSASLHTALGTCDEKLFKREVDLAAFIGARVLVVHEGTLGLTLKDESARIDCCRKACEYAFSKNVRVALENGTIAGLETALAHVEGLEICLDVGHANITVGSIGAFLDRFADKIGHVHLADNYGQIDDHLVPGDGYISMENWRNLLGQLSRMNFAGNMVLEINTFEPRAAAKRAREFLQYVERSVQDEPPAKTRGCY